MPGNDIDDTGEGIGTVNGGHGSPDDLDTFDAGKVEI